MKGFKDIQLVKVNERGMSRKTRRSSLNKTFSEFDDNHLMKRNEEK